MPDANNTVTTGSSNATSIAAHWDAAEAVRDAEAMRGLFDVEVYGIGEFALVPKNDLGRALASAWLHGDLKRSLHLLGMRKPTPGAVNCWENRDNVTRLSFRMELAPLITGGGDPLASGQEITREERDVALAAIAAHREAKRPKTPAAKKRARRK